MIIEHIFTAYFIMLSGLIFISVEFNILLPISIQSLWEWIMLLTLFARLTNVSVLHWMVGLYYYGFLVNEGIHLILVMQT